MHVHCAFLSNFLIWNLDAYLLYVILKVRIVIDLLFFLYSIKGLCYIFSICLFQILAYKLSDRTLQTLS